MCKGIVSMLPNVHVRLHLAYEDCYSWLLSCDGPG